MANVGTAPAGRTLIGTGNLSSPTFAAIGTLSGLTDHGVLIAKGANAFVATAAGTTGQVLTGVTGSDPVWAAPATSGTVTSVSGTLNRVTSTGGTDPIIDISANYVGQTSLTTLGTITTGVWNGTDIALADGGTNASLTASDGGIFYSTATAGAILAGTATAGQVLRSGSLSAPSWSTATYPNSTTANQLLYSSANNVISELANGTTGQFLTATTAGAPGFKTINVRTDLVTGSGNYTFGSLGTLLFAEIELQGGGGGGGGSASTTASQFAAGGGGGAGGYARAVYPADALLFGGAKPYSVGTGGAGGTAGANNGTAGNNSTFGSFPSGTNMSAAGGSGGIGGAASGTVSLNLGGAGGGASAAPTGVGFAGNTGGFALTSFNNFAYNGSGGATPLQGNTQIRQTTGTGAAATANSGGGGAGGLSLASAAAQAGGAGAGGFLKITEYYLV